MTTTTLITDYTTTSEAQTRSFKKDTILLDPQNDVSCVWFLRKGLVRQYVVSENGEEVTIHFFRPGAIFPLMLVAANIPNRFYFQASTNIEVQEFTKKKMMEILESNPKLLMEVTVKFALGLNGLSQRVEVLSTKNTEKKLYLLLDYFAKQFGQEKNSRLTIEIPLTHAEIAAWIGVRRETVSRELSNLTKLGLLSTDKGFFTIDDLDLFAKYKKKLNL